jgi:hypothetical protein
MAHHDFVRLKSPDEFIATPAVDALSAWIAGSRSASAKLRHLGSADELLALMHVCMNNFADNPEIQQKMLTVLLTFVSANKGAFRVAVVVSTGRYFCCCDENSLLCLTVKFADVKTCLLIVQN